jgi:glyoxylase-like metal-dependent hydrolase (beta-lactamase superfamily II)
MNNERLLTEHVAWASSGDLHVFLIVLADGITLIDTGFPGTMPIIAEALVELGRQPEDIHDVLLTHCHIDHAAALAEVKRATGARAWMHGADAALVRTGTSFRPWKPAPGLRNWWFARQIVKGGPQQYEPAEVDEEVEHGDTIPVAGGIKALWTPGHTAGHLAYLWHGDGGVLFTGDAANNVRGLAGPPIFEDRALGLDSLRQLAFEEFEVACFAHGEPIVGGASAKFMAKWGGL